MAILRKSDLGTVAGKRRLLLNLGIEQQARAILEKNTYILRQRTIAPVVGAEKLPLFPGLPNKEGD